MKPEGSTGGNKTELHLSGSTEGRAGQELNKPLGMIAKHRGQSLTKVSQPSEASWPPLSMERAIYPGVTFVLSFFFLDYKIQIKDRKKRLLVQRDSSHFTAARTAVSSPRCCGGCMDASSFPQTVWRIRGLSSGTS